MIFLVVKGGIKFIKKLFLAREVQTELGKVDTFIKDAEFLIRVLDFVFKSLETESFLEFLLG